MSSSIGLPKGMSRDDAYIAGVADGIADAVQQIRMRLERIAADLPGEDFRGVYGILDEVGA